MPVVAALVLTTASSRHFGAPSSGYYGWLTASSLFAYHFSTTSGRIRPVARLSALTAGVTWWFLPAHEQVGILVAGACWYAYFFLLRKQIWLKPLLVALVWAGVTHWIPVTDRCSTASIHVAISRLLMVLALTFGYDWADRNQDLVEQTPTLARRMSVGPFVSLLALLLLGSGWFADASDIHPWWWAGTILAACSLFFTIWYPATDQIKIWIQKIILDMVLLADGILLCF